MRPAATIAGALAGVWLLSRLNPVKVTELGKARSKVTGNVVLGVVLGGVVGAALTTRG